MNCVSIDSDNGLLPIRCQAIMGTRAGLLSIGRIGANLRGILIEVQNFAFMKISVAYRYRKSISIIELFVSIISIYIGFLATNF